MFRDSKEFIPQLHSQIYRSTCNMTISLKEYELITISTAQVVAQGEAFDSTYRQPSSRLWGCVFEDVKFLAGISKLIVRSWMGILQMSLSEEILPKLRLKIWIKTDYFLQSSPGLEWLNNWLLVPPPPFE